MALARNHSDEATTPEMGGCGLTGCAYSHQVLNRTTAPFDYEVLV
jgi:hypothetical protein